MADNLSPEAVRTFLKANQQFLENYLLSSSVPKETFRRLAVKKLGSAAVQQLRLTTKKAAVPNRTQPKKKAPAINGAAWPPNNLVTKRKHILDLATQRVDEQDQPQENSSEPADGTKQEQEQVGLLEELMIACAQAVDADGVHLYLVDEKSHEMYHCKSSSPQDSDTATPSDSRFRPYSGRTLAAFAAKQQVTVRADAADKDHFPEGIGGGTGENDTVESALCHPLIDSSGMFFGLIELYRLNGSGPFTEKDEEVVGLITLWGCAAVYFSQLLARMNKQRKLNDFLLNVARSIFQDIVSMDAVIMKVMNFAQKLVNADRASLFLVDNKTNELYARIFDVGTGLEEHRNLDEKNQKEIRFPIGRGIAGHVASTGQVLNITDAYSDSRFNREVDLKTGFTTKTILCMPIFIRGSIIGVVQMVNKKNGVFARLDEESFETFAIYCGLALHHAKLYDKIRRSEQKYRVALEVLAYHSVANRDEINKLKKQKLPDRVPQLETFNQNALRLSEVEKPLYAVYMFTDLFGVSTNGCREPARFFMQPLSRFGAPETCIDTTFDYDDLVRFVLTVRKNYRRVAYHNWTHGWSVAHAMYVLLKREADTFTPTEKLAMYVACLCHDLDHRGKNNAYMKNMSTPLAAIYTTSVMEHHHFNQAVTILQQDGHNIFKSLSSAEYKQVLSLMKHCILATDLALFFPNKGKLSKLVEDEQFVWDNNDHRLVVQAISMTACDLIASAKPWEIQTDTVKVIFEEFYEQGDAERNNGKEPMPMMDRYKAHELPQMQVGFMKGICLPCYELLAKVLPAASDCVEKCRYNTTKWIELADEQKKKEGETKAKEEEDNKTENKDNSKAEEQKNGKEKNEPKIEGRKADHKKSPEEKPQNGQSKRAKK